MSAAEGLRVELRAAGDGLVGNDDVLRSILAGSGDCIKILDLDGRLLFMSEGGKRVMEVEDFNPLKGCPWPDFWAGKGNIEAKNAVALARRGQIARFKGAADTAKGTSRYWDVQVSPIFGADGNPAHLLSISRDVTDEHRGSIELREAVERQNLLTEELKHRMKNTLAMVGAIAEQTMRGSDVDAARKAFTSRLITLSRAHDILTHASWTDASIVEVVEGALAPHRPESDRIHVSGPDLLLPPKPALALALAIHELATNAAKYGSLSNDAGTVDVAWSIEEAGDTRTFVFIWSEMGGPSVQGEPSRKGFGTRLITRVLAHDFAGEVHTRYEPGGVVCTLRSPLSHLTAAASS